MSALRAVSHRFDADAIAERSELLHRMDGIALSPTAPLVAYYGVLLFIRAHPVSRVELATAERALRRVERFLRHHRARSAPALSNSGLPYTSSVTRFTHDGTRWLLQQSGVRVALEEFADATLDLNAVLGLTLPPIERVETMAGRSNSDLLSALGISTARTLPFLIEELSRLDDQPFVKDHLFDALGTYVRVTPTSSRFSTARNQLPMSGTFFHVDSSSPAFNAEALTNTALPPARRLRGPERDAVVDVIKYAMALTVRETDPTTHMDPASLRVFDLERGISIAIYTMTAKRQMAMESYVGFTAFKNGQPAAYGGAWVFGPRCEFGMNIFEPFRGGESGFMMCQLLRVYRQMFGIAHFEVDSYQFGRDNPDGINSGAFWFYYKYGFRPVEATIGTLVRREKARLDSRRGRRTSKALLRKLTDSNVALRLGSPAPWTVGKVAARIARMTKREFGGSRVDAERVCVDEFIAATRVSRRVNREQRAALVECALLARAFGVKIRPELVLLAQMMRARPTDLYRYQTLLSRFLSTVG